MDTRRKHVYGDSLFSVPAKDFMISPLNAEADLYIVSIDPQQMKLDKIKRLAAGEYTNIRNSVPGISYKIDTTEDFYIKW